MEQIWISPGISYVDLEKAGIRDVDVPRDMPDPKSFDFRFKKQGKMFNFSDEGFGTVLDVNNYNSDGVPVLIEIKYKNNSAETIQASGSSGSQISYYKKFSVQYMYGVEKNYISILISTPVYAS